MKTIFSLLDRFKNIGLPDETVRRATARALKDVCNVEIEIGQISVKKGEVWIETDPHMRSELHVKRRAVMEHLNKELGNSTPKGVR